MALWRLDPTLIRGQAYDGAGAMAGQKKGAAACIRSKYPKAIHMFCASHRLNLCVVKCCNICEVDNMMATTDSIACFFKNSLKRQTELEKWIEDLFAGEKRKKIKEMCKTRWVERHNAFEVFCDLFLPIFCCLESIAGSLSTEWNRETRSDAQSYNVTIFLYHNIGSYSECFITYKGLEC